MAKKKSGSKVGLIALLVLVVMLVLAIVGICIDWINTTVTVLGNSTTEGTKLSELFDTFDGLDTELAGSFKAMASFAILTVILAGATTVLAGICKVLGWKLFRFILVIVAIVCVVCGVVSIITSFTFCDKLGGGSIGDLFSGENAPAAGAWLTAIGGVLAGLAGVFSAVKN